MEHLRGKEVGQRRGSTLENSGEEEKGMRVIVVKERK